jgi:hypothetical protein
LILWISVSCAAWNDRHMPPYSSIGGDGGLANFLPGLAPNCHPPDLRLSSNLD